MIRLVLPPIVRRFTSTSICDIRLLHKQKGHSFGLKLWPLVCVSTGAAGVEKQGEYATIQDKNMAVSPLKIDGTLRGPTMKNDVLRCKTTSDEKFVKLF